MLVLGIVAEKRVERNGEGPWLDGQPSALRHRGGTHCSVCCGDSLPDPRRPLAAVHN